MATNPLETELAFFEQQLPELLRHHAGKFVLIKESELAGVFDTIQAAYAAGLTRFGNVPMLIRQVLPVQPKVTAPALLHGVLFALPQ